MNDGLGNDTFFLQVWTDSGSLKTSRTLPGASMESLILPSDSHLSNHIDMWCITGSMMTES